MLRRRTGEAGRAGPTKPRYIATAIASIVAVAIQGPGTGAREAATPKVVAVMRIPHIADTSILLVSVDRERNSSSAPVSVPNAVHVRFGAPASTVTTAPSVADADNPASRLVNHPSAWTAWERVLASVGSISAASGVPSRGANPANAIDARAATGSSPTDTS